MQDFGRYIKEKRKKLGLTQVQFAEKIGQSWITIWRWEKGLAKPDPLKKKAIKIMLGENK